MSSNNKGADQSRRFTIGCLIAIIVLAALASTASLLGWDRLLFASSDAETLLPAAQNRDGQPPTGQGDPYNGRTIPMKTIVTEGDETGQLFQPVGVEIGNAIKWTDLGVQETDIHFACHFIPGNFDDDPQQELFFCHEVYRVYELDGSSWEPGLGTPSDNMVVCAWDYNKDGSDELVVTRTEFVGEGEGRELSSTTIVMDASGTEYLTFPGGTSFGIVTADLDGDGQMELLVGRKSGSSGKSELHAINGKGISIWSSSDIFAGMIWVAGDLDGDGRDELIGSSKQARDSGLPNLRAFGMDQQPNVVKTLQDLEQYGNPMFAADLNADGIYEIICSQLAVVSSDAPVAKLEQPHGWTAQYITWDIGDEMQDYDMNSRKTLLAIAGESDDDRQKDSLLIWDYAGELVYQESFGEELVHVYVVQDGGQQRIVLQKESGVVISTSS